MKFTSAGTETWIQAIQPAAATPVAVTSLSAANPAVATVGSGDIGKFKEGDSIVVAGYTGDAADANGFQTVGTVSGNTFQLVGVDLSAATGGPFTTGTATPQSAEPAISIVTLTNAKPAVATVGAGALANVVEGEALIVSGTGTVLDGRAFRADSVNSPSNTVTLEGSDLSALASPIVAGSLQPIPQNEMLKICLTSLEHSKEAGDAIDVTTMCGAEQLAGVSLPGTISVEGFVDFFETGQMELLLGTDDNTRRLLQVKIPANGGGGEILYVVTPSGFTHTFETGEAVSFSAEAVVNVKPTYYVGPSA